MVQKILITGGNSGIGFELAKKFAAWPSQFHVYFTARSAERGNAALKNIQAEFPSATVGLLLLDVSSEDSRNNFISEVKNQNLVFDVFFNNAGFAFKAKQVAEEKLTFHQQAVGTLLPNYTGLLALTNAVIENNLVNKGGKIINTASMVTCWCFPRLSEAEQKLLASSADPDSKLTVADLDRIRDEFIEATKNPVDENDNTAVWSCRSTYGMSKLLVRALTHLQARDHPEFYWASQCPGWCRTGMAGDKAPRSAEQGARIAYWIATTEDKLVTENSGCFFRNDDKLFAWGQK